MGSDSVTKEWLDLVEHLGARAWTDDDGRSCLEAVLAESHGLVGGQRSTYKAWLRVDDDAHQVRFADRLTEVGGGAGGLGVRTEVRDIGGNRTITQHGAPGVSTFRFDQRAIVRAFEEAATADGYPFKRKVRAKKV